MMIMNLRLAAPENSACEPNLIAGRRGLHLTDEALAVYLQTFTWPMYFGMVALTAVTSFLGALISLRMLKRHLEKAGLL